MIQVSWNRVPSEYTNGRVLGYNVFYIEVNDLLPANSTVALTEETHLKIIGLKSNTNYSFLVLAFTRKGNGPKSKAYFAKTSPGNNIFSYLLIHLSYKGDLYLFLRLLLTVQELLEKTIFKSNKL